MKRSFVLAALALLLVSTVGSFADSSPSSSKPNLFTQLANSPNGYWVPYPTPPPPIAYYGSPRYYNGPPPPVVYGPRFFFSFHIH
jgi:hypothetical protein